jgi:hypothetical protein
VRGRPCSPATNRSQTAFFGSLPTSEQLAYITNAIPLYRMVYIMLDANVYGRCRRLAQDLAKATGASNVGSIHIGGENRDPGATRFEELVETRRVRVDLVAAGDPLDVGAPAHVCRRRTGVTRCPSYRSTSARSAST